MYSILPSIVSALFLGYGLYVVAEKGFTRTSTGFFVLCVTTFFWQSTWAVLFQVKDPVLALFLIKFGYLLILFLPTSLYHLLTEISERKSERPWVYTSYAIAAVLGMFDVTTDLFVSGYYEYSWGYYPKAGPLHPLHVLQTVILFVRGFQITYQQQKIAPSMQRIRLRLCMASICIYFFAAIDYLCNYGFDFYPPGVVFITISLGLIALAVTKYDLLSSVNAAASVAATIAHEMRTPLSSIGMQAELLAQYLPQLHQGYQLAVANGLCRDTLIATSTEKLSALPTAIQHQIKRANTVIDMMLASARMEQLDTQSFGYHSARQCLVEALETYPFSGRERQRVTLHDGEDFEFFGSKDMLIFVVFNLLKNSIYALKAAGKGDITIALSTGTNHNTLTVSDTGSGIPAKTLPKIFDTFFTTKDAAGAGIGLAFCRRVLASFGGQMRCESVEGQFTTFLMQFPTAPARKPQGAVDAYAESPNQAAGTRLTPLCRKPQTETANTASIASHQRC